MEPSGGGGLPPEGLEERMVAFERRLAGRPFRAPKWLRNPHAQTFWSPIARPRPALDWRREWLPTPDGDRIGLQVLDGEAGAPTLLMLHGLEGSVRSNYVGGLASRVMAHGWPAVLMEFRSCSGEMNRAPRLYHSGETSDLDHVVRHLAGEVEAGKRAGPIVISGVSLGGNVVAKWFGETGAAVPSVVVGGVVISIPFDLEVSGPAIDDALFGFYTWRFLRTLRPKGVAKAEQYPELLDRARIAASRTFEQFDTDATARLHGFEDAWDYWRRCGCGQFLPTVARPLLVVAALDDPFNPSRAIPTKALEDHPWIVPALPEEGGHVGFVYGRPWRTRHWAEEQAEDFMTRVLAPRNGTSGFLRTPFERAHSETEGATGASLSQTGTSPGPGSQERSTA